MPGFIISDPSGTKCEEKGPKSIAQSNLETARSHRWEITIYALSSEGANIAVYAHKCGRPSHETAIITYHHSQNEIYMPGKDKWNPIDISFYETKLYDNAGQTAAEIYKWWGKSVLEYKNSKILGGFKKTIDIKSLDGMGEEFYKYKLLGAWPSKITPTELDYSSNDIAEITVTVVYDKAQEDNNEAGDAGPGEGYDPRLARAIEEGRVR